MGRVGALSDSRNKAKLGQRMHFIDLHIAQGKISRTVASPEVRERGHFEFEEELDTVNYANPTTETRTQVLELGPRY